MLSLPQPLSQRPQYKLQFNQANFNLIQWQLEDLQILSVIHSKPVNFRNH